MNLAPKSFAVSVAIAATVAPTAAQAELREMTKKVSGTTMQYKVVLPNGYDPAKAYPAILAIGGRRCGMAQSAAAHRRLRHARVLSLDRHDPVGTQDVRLAH